MAITIANIRRFAGPRWTPEKISFGFRPREAPLSAEIFDGTRVAYRPGETYLQFPRAMLGHGLCAAAQESAEAQSAVVPPLPNDLAGLVSLQIESLLSGHSVSLELLAESLGMNGRRLQRGLADQGASFTALLGAVRLRRAAEWLQRTDKPVVEIALDLGYTDASNFTRAFRRAIGVSPSMFRKAAGRH
jgi:AraC-like DNA-binding protein